MIPLDLTTGERRAFEAVLRDPYEFRVRVRSQRLNGDDLSELSARLLDGQVNIDVTGETSRQASVTLDDPHHTLNLDSDSPADGALYIDRMLRIDWQVWVPALSRWVAVPVFTGPVVGLRRNGAVVEVECLGKEHLARAEAWHPMTLKKGADTVNAIRAIMAERAGETRFAFPNLVRRLPANVSLGRMTQPWVVAQRLARSLNRQLYYDGEGVLRLRTIPRGSVWTFRDGSGRTVLGDPSITYDLASVKNTVWVVGAKPKGSKTAVTNYAIANAAHALSPWKIGRNNRPRFLVEKVENDHVRTKAACGVLARRVLADKLMEGVQVELEAVPVPHLEPLDIVRLDTDYASVTFALKQFSLPLIHSGTMSVGANRRVTPRLGAIR